MADQPARSASGAGRKGLPRWLWLGVALLFLGRLHYAPFWNPDEGRYASAALEMVHPLDGTAPDWVVPHLNTIPRLNKPPLVYWLAAGCFTLLGASETAGRLGSALSALAVAFLVWRLGRAMFSDGAGILGAVVWVTSTLPFAMARVLNTDMLLCGAIVVTCCGLWFALESETARGRWTGHGLAGVGMGLSLLAKGPVGVALPLLIVFVYVWLARRWTVVAPAGALAALAIALLLGGPWYLLVEARHPGFVRDFLLVENFSRFAGHREFHHSKPLWWYLPIVALGMFPWSAFLIPALSRGAEGEAAMPQQRARLFLWLWAGLWVAFFSLSKVKLATYILPALPALALLIGASLERASHDATCGRLRFALGATVFLYGLMALLLPVALLREHITLFGHERRLLAGKTMPAAAMQPYAIAIAVVLVAGLLGLLWAWRSRDAWRIAAVQTVTAVALFITLLRLAPRIGRYTDASPLMRALAPHVRPADVFIEYQDFQPAATYYLRRPAIVVGYVTTSGLSEPVMRQSPLFFGYDATTVPQLLSASQHVYILMTRQSYRVMARATPNYLVAANNDDYVVSNRPAPDGFHFDCRAPANKW